MMQKTNKKKAKLASHWGCDARTIARWKKARAPLHDEEQKMRAWLSTRKNLPARTMAILEKLRAKPDATPPTEPPKEPDLKLGAGPALSRLERSEAAAFTAFEKAVQAGDLVTIKALRQSWLEISEQLRKLDAQVLENRREVGSEIPRAECERIFRAIACCWSNGLSSVADALGEIFPDAKASSEVLWATFAVSLASASVGFGLPSWVIPSITSGTLLLDADQKVGVLAEGLREFVRLKVQSEQVGPGLVDA